MTDPLHPEPAPGPSVDDLALATRLHDLAFRVGLPLASAARKRARFLTGRAEHGDDLAALDLMGEALEEVDDLFCYTALAFVFDPRPELLTVLVKCRELEAAVEACLPPAPLQVP